LSHGLVRALQQASIRDEATALRMHNHRLTPAERPHNPLAGLRWDMTVVAVSGSNFDPRIAVTNFISSTNAPTIFVNTGFQRIGAF
jgi:hypothetical protein